MNKKANIHHFTIDVKPGQLAEGCTLTWALGSFSDEEFMHMFKLGSLGSIHAWDASMAS